MVEEIILNKVEIKEKMTGVIQHFFDKYNEQPSSINIKFIPSATNDSVCIQVKIVD